MLRPVVWENKILTIIDQTRLPGEHHLETLHSLAGVWRAIQTLQVRGAPAIGICAAFGVLVGLIERAPGTLASARAAVDEIADYLASSRPTAVNLFWALDRMRAVSRAVDPAATPAALFDRLEAEAEAILAEDLETGRRIGEAGADLIPEGAGVLTHCNAGALATGGEGTALAPLYRAKDAGRCFRVYADETRPLLQGARLTAWELQQSGIDVTLICDSMAAVLMREGKVDLVIVGADRVAMNGDTANKIGTYGLAVLARAHNVPFYVAIPASTLDPALADGSRIPIEQRAPEEITHWRGDRMAPEGVAVYNPAFDVTPAGMISGIITEYGLIQPPYDINLKRCVRLAQPAPGTPAA